MLRGDTRQPMPVDLDCQARELCEGYGVRSRDNFVKMTGLFSKMTEFNPFTD